MKKGEEHLYAVPFDVFIQEVRKKKAYPILVTPVYRRRFDDNGLLQNSLGEYPLAMRILAEKEQVPLLDLHKRSFELFSKLGAKKQKKFFFCFHRELTKITRKAHKIILILAKKVHRHYLHL